MRIIQAKHHQHTSRQPVLSRISWNFCWFTWRVCRNPRHRTECSRQEHYHGERGERCPNQSLRRKCFHNLDIWRRKWLCPKHHIPELSLRSLSATHCNRPMLRIIFFNVLKLPLKGYNQRHSLHQCDWDRNQEQGGRLDGLQRCLSRYHSHGHQSRWFERLF